MNVVIRIEGWDRSGKDAVRLGCLWKKMTNFAAMLKECMMTGVVEAGCDEAGRGCLCGPDSAAGFQRRNAQRQQAAFGQKA